MRVLGGLVLALCAGVSAMPARAETHELDYYLHLSDRQLFDLATREKIGGCWIQDAGTCETCHCRYYVKVDGVAWMGKGWPVSPLSGDSTGCVSDVLWPGYTGSMATPDLIHNAAEQLRDALAHPNNPCLGKCGT